MNRQGQAMIEALIVGTFCLLGLSYVFMSGLKIIQSAIREEELEEQFIYFQKP